MKTKESPEKELEISDAWADFSDLVCAIGQRVREQREAVREAERRAAESL